MDNKDNSSIKNHKWSDSLWGLDSFYPLPERPVELRKEDGAEGGSTRIELNKSDAIALAKHFGLIES